MNVIERMMCENEEKCRRISKEAFTILRRKLCENYPEETVDHYLYHGYENPGENFETACMLPKLRCVSIVGGLEMFSTEFIAERFYDDARLDIEFNIMCNETETPDNA